MLILPMYFILQARPAVLKSRETIKLSLYLYHTSYLFVVDLIEILTIKTNKKWLTVN